MPVSSVTTAAGSPYAIDWDGERERKK